MAAVVSARLQRATRRLPHLGLAFFLLGCLGFAANQAAYPYKIATPLSALQPKPDGLLASDFTTRWPFRVNKHALDKLVVELSDGARLERFDTGPTPRDVTLEKNYFFVDHPHVVLRIDRETLADPDAFVTVTVPLKLRDVFYKLPLGVALGLLALHWLLPGFQAARRSYGWRRPTAVVLGSLVVFLGGLAALPVANGPVVWLSLLAILVAPLALPAWLLRTGEPLGKMAARTRDLLTGAALVVAVVLLSCSLFEGYLGLAAEDFEDTKQNVDNPGVEDAARQPDAPVEPWFQLPEGIVRQALARHEAITLPDAWRRRKETLEGATSAYTWHGALHVRDQEGFRRLNGPFAAKDPKTFRVMVVGDSLTYGLGVAEEWTYSSLLEQSLQSDYRVEVVNLGRRGYQSADNLSVLHRILPQLEPDLVVHAVCLNDFLPSGAGIKSSYAFPFPFSWRVYLKERTKLSRLVEDAYGSALLALGLRVDFYDDILAGEEGYQERFARDVAAMNRFVVDSGLPAILGIVFHQSPSNQRAGQLVAIAEKALADAGFDLISVKPWREKFKDRRFHVSRWEGHPNELAHAAVAESLNTRILARGYLRGYETAIE